MYIATEEFPPHYFVFPRSLGTYKKRNFDARASIQQKSWESGNPASYKFDPWLLYRQLYRTLQIPTLASLPTFSKWELQQQREAQHTKKIYIFLSINFFL